MLDEYKEDINLDRARPGRLWLMRSNIIVAVLLLFTMLAGGYFRFMGNNWDDYIHFHPDERYTTGVAASLGGNLTLSSNEPELMERCQSRYPDNDGRGGFFDAECSPYNPDNVVTTRFIYGTLPLFTARLTAETFAEVSGDNVWLDSNGMPLAWRALNAAADTLVIFVVFLIGLRLHNKRVGLLAAILYACSVFPIQIAHFGTVDAVSNLFVTITIYYAVRAQDSGSLWDYGAFGMALGAALSGRLNIAPLAGLIILVALLQVIPAFDQQLAWRERGRLATKHFGGLVLAGFMTLLIFRLANPYAFTGPSFLGLWPNDRFLDMISQAQWQVSGNMDTPPNWQWVNRIPYLFSWQGMVLWGMGIGLGLTGWFSWVWSIVRVLRGKVGATRNLLLVAWIGAYFVMFGGIWVMSMRYYLPLYPALAVLAAWALMELVQRTNMPDVAQWRRLGAMALLVGVTGFTVLWALMFTNIYRHMATFTQASYWV
jgi:hypothetical protein